jgi:hypothetical protein
VLTRRAHAQFWLAHDLLTRLPAVHAAMDAGALDEPRARVLSEWTTELDPEQARALCDELLPQARGLTTGQLIEQIKKLAIAFDPEWARRRYEQAVADRKVVGYRNADGSANLSECTLLVDRVAAASGHIDTDADIINQLLPAAHLHESDDKGGYHNGDDTSGASRNDGDEDSSAAPTDQPTPTAPDGAGMELRVRLSTLLWYDQRPAELAGWGTIHAELARDRRHPRWCRVALRDHRRARAADPLWNHPSPTHCLAHPQGGLPRDRGAAGPRRHPVRPQRAVWIPEAVQLRRVGAARHSADDGTAAITPLRAQSPVPDPLRSARRAWPRRLLTGCAMGGG